MAAPVRSCRVGAHTRVTVSTYDVAIIGGGCIGLATARSLLDRGDLEVVVFEKEPELAQHQSGRNSGVLHPGFNYEPGSLKAQFAVEGTRRMKQFAQVHDVPLDECGVLVVATTERDETNLERLFDRARANGVDVERCDGHEAITAIEPHAAGRIGLWCPAAASIDSSSYIRALAAAVTDAGGEIRLDSTVSGLDVTSTGIRVETDGGPVSATHVVNAAGLHADRIAHQLGVGSDVRIIPFRGEYYELRPERRELTQTMIYPTPDPAIPFLGVHFTRRTDGSVIVGPNAVLALGREAYRRRDVSLRDTASILGYPGFWRLLADRQVRQVAVQHLHTSLRKAAFVAQASRLVPSVTSVDLVRGHAGNRAQVVDRSGRLVMDPLVEAGPRSTHVLNAVSPGLTSSLPFGDHVAEQVVDRLDSA